MSILCLTGITRAIDTPSKHPLSNGKIDATRIADPVLRLNGALPISYTQFPSKRKKNACKLLFRPLTLVPARAIIFLPTSHCIRGPYIPSPNHTCKRDSSKFSLLRELPKYYFSYSCTLSNYVLFL